MRRDSDAAGPGKAERNAAERHAPGEATVRGAGARGAARGLAGWALGVTLGAVLSAGILCRRATRGKRPSDLREP